MVRIPTERRKEFFRIGEVGRDPRLAENPDTQINPPLPHGNVGFVDRLLVKVTAAGQ
ncbi:MAG: hypothetical protein KDA68_06795 [Planctomycetaceae bacterium]|nr:hypothetical protein [Planctomycetaceae bacterium]